MLLEYIPHYKNLHFAIDFSNVAQEAPHYHKETEMALVIRGHALYRIHHQQFLLKEGDLIVVDTEDLHYICESSEDVILLCLYVDMEAFTDLYPNIDFMIFACDEFNQEASRRQQKMQNRIAFLAHYMAQMMFLYQEREKGDQPLADKLQELLYMMVNQLQGFFIEDNRFHSGKEDASPVDLDRLYRIIKYMYLNYDRKITLEDLMEIEPLSRYYISHLIKKTSGLSFHKLLNYIRVEAAEKRLNEDKLTLTQISEFCGFSSPAYFNQCFKEWHGITPAQYRREKRPSKRKFHEPLDRQQALQLLRPYLHVDLPEAPGGKLSGSSRHIFLSIQPHYRQGKDVRDTFPLSVFVASRHEVISLLCSGEELKALRPRSLRLSREALEDAAPQPQLRRQILDHLKRCGLPVEVTEEMCPYQGEGAAAAGQVPQRFLQTGAVALSAATHRGPGEDDEIRREKDPAAFSTAASAFAWMMTEKEPRLRLRGEMPALFTEEGIPTHFYGLYKAFSQMQGSVGEQQRQHLLVKGRGETFLMVCHDTKETDLKVHIQFHPSNWPDLILRRTLGAGQDAAPGEGGGLTGPGKDGLRDWITHLAEGPVELVSPRDETNLRVNLTVAAGEVLILAFPDRS